MGIDPNIILRGAPAVEPLDVAGAYGRGLTLAGLIRQREAQQFELEQAQRGAAEYEAFKGALARGAKAEELAAIAPRLAADHARGQAEAQRIEREAAAGKERQRAQQAARVSALAGTVWNAAEAERPTAYARALARARAEGIDVSEMPAEWNPAAAAIVRTLYYGGMEPGQQERAAEAAREREAQSKEPVYTLGDLTKDPSQMQVRPSQYGQAASFVRVIRPGPEVGSNYGTGAQTFTFPDPIARTVTSVKAEGAVGARPRQERGSRSSGEPRAEKPKRVTAKDLAAEVLEGSAASGGTTVGHAIANAEGAYRNDPRFTPGMRLAVLGELKRMGAEARNPFAKQAGARTAGPPKHTAGPPRYTAGQAVKLRDGRTVTISKINADGTFEHN